MSKQRQDRPSSPLLPVSDPPLRFQLWICLLCCQAGIEIGEKKIEKWNYSVLYRPAGRTAISTVTMCLRAPKLWQHVPESIHGPIGICLLQDKCVVVSSTFEDQVDFAVVFSSTVFAQVKMFTGCGQFLRMVEAEPGRRFKHPSDMVALR